MAHWMDRIAAFDTETSGTDTETARIVIACIALIDESGSITEQWNWLINPGAEIPEEATNIHGVTTSYAKEHGLDPKLAIAEVQAILLELNLPVVAFNAPFDFSILRAECDRHGHPFELPSIVIDPFVIDKRVDKFRRGQRQLGNVASQYGIQLLDAHAATADAVAAGQIAQLLLRLPSVTELVRPSNAMALQEIWKEEQNNSFESYLRRTSDPEATVQRGWPLLERSA